MPKAMEQTWENPLSSLEMHEDLQRPMNLFDGDRLVRLETDMAAAAGIYSNGCPYDPQKHVVPTSTPAIYVVPFDKSTTSHDCFDLNNKVSFGDVISAAAISMPSSSSTPKGKLRSRSFSESLHHIMTERKRRQSITEKFIALSAAIPGLKRINKASVLEEAISYVKQLQNRVKELEEETSKTSIDSLTLLKKSHLCVGEESTCREKTSGDCCYRLNEALPEIKARVFKNEVLIRIHCGRQEDVLLKILSQLETHHLTVPKTCVLPFGNTLGITIVAQMGENYGMKAKDLVKNLKLALL